MRKTFGIAGLAALSLAVATPAAQACGGFFCRNVPVDQAGEKIVFGVDHDTGDVFAIIQIQYAGKAEDFSWVIPVPSTPSVAVSSDEVFRRLGPPTIPQFRLKYKTEGTCKTEDMVAFGGVTNNGTRLAGPQAESTADTAGVTVVSREKIGPFDATVLLPTDPKALEEWLTKEGYRIPDSFGDLSKSYVEQKHYFVALKLLKDKETGDLQPVVLKLQEKYPCVPVRLTAIAAQENMPIILWVFARTRAIPKNYYHVALNEALIDWVGASPRYSRGAFPIGGFGGSSVPAPNYDAVVTQSMKEAGGNGFVTELATSSSIVKTAMSHGYAPDKLKGLDPKAFMSELRNQGYPNGGLMQNLMRKYLPIPADLASRGTDETTWWNALFAGSGQFQTTQADFAKFDASAFAEDIRNTFVKPIDEAAELIGRLPYVTRLYTTMTVAAMGAKDPLFAFNSKLPDVSNLHQADATILCNPNVYEYEAPYRISLANGHSFTIEPDKGRRYLPLALGSMPAAFRIEQLAEEADTELIADNKPKIDEVLKNLPVPKSVGSAGPGCACNGLPNMKLGSRKPDTSAADGEAVFWGVALGGLFAWRRRRRHDKG